MMMWNLGRNFVTPSLLQSFAAPGAGEADHIAWYVWRGDVSAMVLPQLAGRRMVTDGGMETDLIFHHGVDLPLFAAFPLVDSSEGRSLLTAYYDGYAAIARRAGAGLMLESATWRASGDWGDRLCMGGRVLRHGEPRFIRNASLTLYQTRTLFDSNDGP